MLFTNLTRRIEIGANCYALQFAGGKTVVLDSGMHPKQEGEQALPDFARLADDSVDAIVLSHSHHDHVGTLPLLMRRHPRAPVFMTEPTRLLSGVMLHNSVNVMCRQREDAGIMHYPLFTHREVDNVEKRWRGCPLHQRFNLEGERVNGRTYDDEITLEFFDAGHVLGAAGTLIRAEKQTIFYTGDVNFDDQSLSRGARFPEEGIDTLIIETTRGDHETPAGFSRKKEEQRLAATIRAAFARGGAVVMPLFALGKTQELLAMLHGFMQRGELPLVPIYIGGLSAKLTELYDKLAHSAPRLRPDLHLMSHVAPFVLAVREAGDAPFKPSRIYALSSGMMTEKTLSNFFARRVLSSPTESLFFVGYADPESPAGRIRSASQGDEITLDKDFPPQVLRCAVEQFNFSGHASRESLRAYANKLAPKTIVLVHGDEPAVEWFRKTLAADLPGSRILTPIPGEPVEI